MSLNIVTVPIYLSINQSITLITIRTNVIEIEDTLASDSIKLDTLYNYGYAECVSL
jgi:hypothetical protein